jgi:1,4-dihydroxy-2-naphthoate octaprenyltransferase
MFAAMLVLAYVAPIAIWAAGGLSAWILLSLLSAPLAVRLMRTVGTRTDGPALNGALAASGQLLALFSLLLAAGVLAS